MSKRHRHHRPGPDNDTTSASSYALQGYEATLIRGQQRLADEVTRRGIEWQGDEDVRVDRYDILHLLPSLPSVPRSPSPSSSRGWSPLPSDTEDTFFLSSDENDEYERFKKRRRLDEVREERMRGLVEEKERREREQAEGKRRREGDGDAEDVWGGNDEEPTPQILSLMTHTLTSLFSSPNPQVLELRILTHHAKDPRFAFLRGRYKDVWDRMKRGKGGEEGKGKAKEVETEAKQGGLAGLGDYGDSSDEDGEEEDVVKEPEDEEVPPPPPELPEPHEQHPPSPPPKEAVDEGSKPDADEEGDSVAEVETKRARREKAKAWARERKAREEEDKGKDAPAAG